MKKIAVIGGGAAGMMAALAAAEQGAEVLLLEKNEKLGKKLFITGKGRCNLTNTCEDQEFFSHVVSNPKFLYSSIYAFDHTEVMGLIEKLGCPLKEERGGRVFPVSDHSSDVIKALEKGLKKAGVEIRLHTEVEEMRRLQEQGFMLKLRGGAKETADAVVIAVGGHSYAGTGSDGSFDVQIRALGHGMTEARTALVPLVLREEAECKEMQGLALKNVEARLYLGKKEIYSGFGEMLFTHFGVSGPLILTASSVYQKRRTGRESEKTYLRINLKPALSDAQLDERILREFDANKNKQFGNVLGSLLPGKMREVFPGRCGIAAHRAVNTITKEERQRLIASLHCLEYEVTGTRGFSEAIVTQGGVQVKEIDPSTMESKLVPGLYFAGEVIDVDAHTGGYNLQIAWSTGHLAGVSAAG
ncbi:MAG: NAD(P)/FAD-dependent oxidoreductase [Lachnospiraceae bacterium]|nr:NAD(P)/FAD-dependent oxidoreductase [Lachnospiraceae bacterium]